MSSSLIKKYFVLAALAASFAPPPAAAWAAQKKSRATAPNPNLLAAENYLRQHNYAKAVEALELLVGVEPRSDERVYVLLVTTHLQAGDSGKALAACRQALVIHPASRRLEELYLTALPPTEAKTRLAEQIKTNDSPTPRKALGRLLLRENPRDPQIEQLLSGAVRARPRDAEARYLYGQWACLNNRFDACLTELNKALALAPDNNEARMQIHTLIGMAEEQRGRVAPAGVAFAEALRVNRRLSPPDPPAAFEYAKFLLNHARDEEAQRVVEQILAWSPNFGPARFERAKFLAKKGQLNEAAREAEAALRAPGTNPTRLRAVHAFLAKTYFALGRESETRKHEQIIQTPP